MAPSAAQSASSPSAPIASQPETCQSKTINYITHTLPQQCLRTSWSSANATAATTDAGEIPKPRGPAEATATETVHSGAVQDKGEDRDKEKRTDGQDDGQEDLATGSFMSFEEWKVLQLKKSGQDPAELQARRRQQQQQQQRHSGHYAHGAGGDINIDSIGDDGEIALDFDVLNEKVSEMAEAAAAQVPGQRRYSSGGGDDGSASDSSGGGAGGASQEDAVVYAEGGVTQYHRSKDAGKTSKERFSFASFDAGATVRKTNKGVKNAKAILAENKDSYMLLECGTRDKHVIVELSDDILVDTIVLANYEFFSSMVRRFRVSVSDRYPVKADRWKPLGEYEARNSRDIQPFLIENPQIWAKYIRIDFLTHYGHEYYCPISLLRVHGTRMLDSWKDSENGRDEEEDDEPEHHHPAEPQQAEEQQQQHGGGHEESAHEDVPAEHAEYSASQEAASAASAEPCQSAASDEVCDPTGSTSWDPLASYAAFFLTNSLCLPLDAPASVTTNETAAEVHGSVPSAAVGVPPSPHFHASVPAAADAEKNSLSSAERQPSHSPSTSSASADSAGPARSAPAAEVVSEPTQASVDVKSYASASSSSSMSSSSASDASSIPQPSRSTVARAAASVNVSAQDSAASAASSSTPATPISHQTPQTPTPQAPPSKSKTFSSRAAGVAAPGSSRATSGSSGGASAPGSTAGSGASASTSAGSATAPGGGSSGSSSAAAGNTAPTPSSSPSSGGGGGGVPPMPSIPPPPAVQESFFKTVTKRLQLLESNTSLSLQYIEDQSRFLQEALRRMERKQIARVDSFLDTLNQTVLSELRTMRQQYDQIWQSTVLALETQREQNQRETVALSDRLNVLADEVVFQKRMAILQSVLLLCCLALVIFSRGLLSAGGTAAAGLVGDVHGATAAYMAMHMSPSSASPQSPPSPPSPPSGSSTTGFRSNLRSFSFRYSAGSPPPPPHLLRSHSSISTNGSGGSSSSTVGGRTYDGASHPAPVDRDKVLPLTPTTPTMPTSTQSPASSGEDGPVSTIRRGKQLRHQSGEVDEESRLVAPKPITPPPSLRLSDIKETIENVDEEELDANSNGADPDGGIVPQGGGSFAATDVFASNATTPPTDSIMDQNQFPSLPVENNC